MKRTFATPLALACAVTALFGQERRGTIPAFPTQADAITADVVVLDKDGRPVRDIRREEFTLLEDGRPQTIVAFEARELAAVGTRPDVPVADERVASNIGAAPGRTFAFLVDDLGTQPLHMEEVKKSIGRWLLEKADPRDEVTLCTVSGDAWWSDRIDRGRADLEAVLARMKGKKLPERTREWISDWEAYRIANFEDATGAAAASSGPAPSGPATGPPAAAPLPSSNPLGQISERVAARTGLRTGEVRMRAMETYNRLNGRTHALLGATERLSRGLAGTRGRKAILVFSEGFLYDASRTAVFDRAIDASQRANTAVYFIDAKGLAGNYLFGLEQPRAPDERTVGVISMEENFLETSGTEHVAENTGGTSVRNTNDLFAGLAKVAEESSAYYLLGYQPERALDGRWHKLEVKVSRPGVKVRTRRGYQATPPPAPAAEGKPDRKNAGKEKTLKRPLDPAVMTSGAIEALPLRLAPYVLDADKDGLARAMVVVEFDTSRLSLRSEGDRRTGAVDLTLLGMSRDHAKTYPLDERVRIEVAAKAAGGWMALFRELRLPPGVVQVRALVRDVASGLAGTVVHRLEVPALDGPYLATPIVTDRLIVGSDKSPRLVPVAHRLFRPQGHLYCSYEVFGMTNAKGEATTRVAGGFTIQGANGQIVRQAAPTPIAVGLGGKVVRLFAVPLAGLEAGEYELVVEVVDQSTGRSLRSREPFVLAGAT